MRARRDAPPHSEELPLKYVGGDPSLDLVNTADWTAAGPENERLLDFERLTRWAEGAGVLPRRSAQRLRERAAVDAAGAEAALRKARRVRGVLRRLFIGVATGRHEDGAVGAEFASLLRAALNDTRLERRGRLKRHAWVFPDATMRLDGLLAPVVWSAARLLASDDAEALRVCAGPDCGWLFVDRSRNGLRRWCQMQTCGTLEKTRRRRKRSARRGA